MSIFGGSAPAMPAPTDPVADKAAADARAAQAANALAAARKRRARQSSLLATGMSGEGVTAPASSVLAGVAHVTDRGLACRRPARLMPAR